MTDSPPQDSDPWVVRLKGEPAKRDSAIEELRALLVRGLSRSLPHRYGGRVQIDDVVQVTLLKILDRLDTFRGESRFVTWAMSIATREGMSELRKRYYRDVPLDVSGETTGAVADFVDSTAPTSLESSSQREVLTLLQRLIDETLTEKQRIAIRGTLNEVPIEVIAARLSSNRNAVYKLFHDARLRLREGFEASGLLPEDILEALS